MEYEYIHARLRDRAAFEISEPQSHNVVTSGRQLAKFKKIAMNFEPSKPEL